MLGFVRNSLFSSVLLLQSLRFFVVFLEAGEHSGIKKNLFEINFVLSSFGSCVCRVQVFCPWLQVASPHLPLEL